MLMTFHHAGFVSTLLSGFLLLLPDHSIADEPLRMIVFGAHPDDCEYDAGGTAALWAKQGCKVKFVSLTNGDIGHHETGGAILARRRLEEARLAAAILGKIE